jgi:hypothetical protein
LPGHIDIGCLLIKLINHFYIDAGIPGDADETIIDAFRSKELLEESDIGLTKIAGHNDLMAVVRQERCDIDPFATGIEPDCLASIDSIQPKIINSHGLIDCRVKRNRRYLHELPFSCIQLPADKMRTTAASHNNWSIRMDR